MSEESAPKPAIRSALLDWYDAHRRDLPWRSAPGEPADPYHVWVSEVMLQQTRVEAVRPYFERWIERFPHVHALAAAPHDEVMKAWEGLGYYSRARNLHRAARVVAERYDGRVPAEADAFGALPGVGRYTRGAVLSIAFGREEPVVDGNVRRVLARLHDLAEPRDAELWAMATALVPGERPGDLNQALMELGATVCTPRAPDCARCPLHDHCRAREAGTQEKHPLPKKRRALPHEQTASVVIVRGDEVLLARTRADRRLGGLWEFPSVVRGPDEDAALAAARGARERLALEVEPVRALCTVDHVFTHVRVTYAAILCAHLSGAPEPLDHDEVRWVSRADIRALALPRAQQRIAERLLADRALAERTLAERTLADRDLSDQRLARR